MVRIKNFDGIITEIQPDLRSKKDQLSDHLGSTSAAILILLQL